MAISSKDSSARFSLLIFALFFLNIFAYPSAIVRDNPRENSEAIEKTRILVAEIVAESFPELAKLNLKMNSFESPSVFFKTRFSISRLLTLRGIGIVLSVNPAVFRNGPSDDAIRAILAHELAHADYYRRRSNLKFFGMIGLIDGGRLTKFERRADLTAIENGYGPGLKEYREWLYKNIPAENLEKKKRNYFTPQEIDLIVAAHNNDSSLLKKLHKEIPLSLSETATAISKARTLHQ